MKDIMGQKKRSPKIIQLFSCKRFLSSQLQKKIKKLQYRATKRSEKQTGHKHTHTH
jgi:hypothetical protein